MALTKVQFQNINTNLTAFSDPITITNFGNVGNRDIGEVFDRSQGGASNVTIIWQESTKSFRMGYTSSTGKDSANLTMTGNANLRVGNLYAESISWANGTAFTSSVPGGSSTQLQYNNSGTFAGATSLTTDGNGTLNAITIQATTIGNVGAGLVGANITGLTSVQGPIGVYGANTGSFTTTTTTGNATAAALTVNGTATVGSTLSALAGLQGTAIGNLQQSSGTFTTLLAYAGLNNTIIGNVTPSSATFTSESVSGNSSINALTINTSATIGTTLGVTGNAIIGNLTVSGTTTFTGNILGNTTHSANVIATGFFFANGTPVGTGGGGSGITYTASSTAPLSPKVGDQWYYTTLDILYEYQNVGTANVWIDTSGPTLPGPNPVSSNPDSLSPFLLMGA